MASQVPIPPWLNIDPVAPVGRYLEGYRTGLSAAEAQAAQAARAQQMALAQQQAAELNAYRQEQQAAEVKHWEDQLRLQQAKDQREAQKAAQQMRGMAGAKAMLDAGEEWPKILAAWGPDIFAGEPQAMASAMHAVQPPRAATFGKTPEGYPIVTGPTGAVQFYPKDLREGIAGEPPLTTAVKGRLQTGLLQGEKAAELGTELWNKLSPKSIGLLGNINRVAINEGLAQFFPGIKISSVSDVQSLLANFNEKAVAAITASGDKRVSNADMARYMKMLPKSSPGESLDSARAKIATFIDELRRESIKDAERLGVPRPEWTLTKEEIIRAYQKGELSEQKTEELLRRYHTKSS